jgi:hypothetical protein
MSRGAFVYSRLFLGSRTLDQDDFARLLRKRRATDAANRREIYRGRADKVVIWETKLRPKK